MTVATQKPLSRRGELESLIHRFPDVPPEVIVKEDLLTHGLRFTEQALHAGERYQAPTVATFLWERVRPEQIEEHTGGHRRIPKHIELHGGLYGLRGRLRVQARINPASPYVIDLCEDGKLWLCEEEENRHRAPLAELHPYHPLPSYFFKKLSDGTPFTAISPGYGWFDLFHQCQYASPQTECKFCDINSAARVSKGRGILTGGAGGAVKKVEHVVETVEEQCLREQYPPESCYRPRYIHLSGGTIITRLMGKTEVEFYREYVAAIIERIGRRWPMYLASHPYPTEIAKSLRDVGVEIRSSNIEVWDKRLFEIICPGKAKTVGRDEWIRRVIEEVDVFGVGRVCPGFVNGVELVQPWGFSTIDEALKSNYEGMNFLMSHGVVPRVNHWCPQAGSLLAGQQGPPLEYYIRNNMNWYELWKKWRLPPPYSGFRLMGPGRNEYPVGAAEDMGS